MNFYVEKIQIRILRINRDFTYVDKIGGITNAFLNLIPHTELQRSGQYGILVIRNEILNFESQISKTEVNISVNMKTNIEDADFKSKLESLFDLIEKIFKVMKDFSVLPDHHKSIISVIDGYLTNFSETEYKKFLENEVSKSYLSIASKDVKQIVYTWDDESGENHINFTPGENDEGESVNQIIYGFQDFKSDLTFSDITRLIKNSVYNFSGGILGKIKECCE